jgi:hypothetical protein
VRCPVRKMPSRKMPLRNQQLREGTAEVHRVLHEAVVGNGAVAMEGVGRRPARSRRESWTRRRGRPADV